MSLLTESSLMFNSYEAPTPQKNNWLGRVYLCIEKSKIKDNIEGINCYTFGSIEKAENYYESKKSNVFANKKWYIVSTCKWSPLLFHKQIINYKLNKNYSVKNITIFQRIV
jgi:hypothetical protein